MRKSGCEIKINYKKGFSMQTEGREVQEGGKIGRARNVTQGRMTSSPSIDNVTKKGTKI